MTVRTIYPSGDTTGVTDTATLAAAMALMGAGDELKSVGGQWYFLPTGNGHFYTVNANNQTYTFGENGNQFRAVIVGPGAATTTLGFISIQGKTGITIKGVSGARAYFDGNRALTKNVCATAGQGLVIANQTVWGSDNAIVLADLEFVDPPGPQHLQIQSCQGGTGTRIFTSATSAAVAAGHGNDFDAVVQDKPTRDWTFTDCDFDSYGGEALKHENSISITHTRGIFRNTVTLTQDNADPYSELGPLTFTDCTFYGPVTMSYLKHKGVSGGSLPAISMSLSSAAIGAGVTVTATGAFAAGDLNKFIAQKGTSGALGLSQITGVAGVPNSVTVTNIQTWSSTGPFTSGNWSLGEVNQSGSGNVTFTRPVLIGDGAVIWGPDQVASNYGTITLADGSAVDDDGVSGGSNFLVLPSGVVPTITGTQTGRRSNVIHYIAPAKKAKAPAGPGSALSLTQSFASSWVPSTDIWTLLLAANASTGDEWVVMDGRYFCVAGSSTDTESYSTGNKSSVGLNGQSVTLRAKHKWKAIIDGTGTTATNWVLDNNSTSQARIRGFKVQNFTAAGNNCGVNLQGTSAVQVVDMWFHNMSTANGGAGGRSTTTGGAGWIDCTFTSCSCITATGGAGLYTTSVNATYRNLIADSCTTSAQMGGFARFDFAAGLTQIDGILATNCSATGALNGGAVGGKNFSLRHMTGVNNTAGNGTGNDLYIAAGTSHVRNCWLRSSSTAMMVAGGATVLYANSNINGVTATGTATNQTGNINTAEDLTASYGLTSTSSVGYRTGATVDNAGNGTYTTRDLAGIHRAGVPSMGAYEFLGARTGSSVRTAATARTVAVRERPKRGYP